HLIYKWGKCHPASILARSWDSTVPESNNGLGSETPLLGCPSLRRVYGSGFFSRASNGRESLPVPHAPTILHTHFLRPSFLLFQPGA
ncbi:MAG: hypothetical protein WAM96_14425, partial [Candidatus Acidiferrales bacterium]